MGQYVRLRKCDVVFGDIVRDYESEDESDYQIILGTIKADCRKVFIHEYGRFFHYGPGDITPYVQVVEKLISLPYHPNIASYRGLFVDAGMMYIIRDFSEGQTFATIIPNHCLEIDEIMHIAEQLCEGLKFLHKNGIYCHKLRPENITYDQNKNVIIETFGCQEDEITQMRRCALPRHQNLIYKAPEVLTMSMYVREMSGVYCIGMVLWMLFSKRIPKVRRLDTRLITDGHVRLLIAGALKINPEDRPSLVDFHNSLKDFDVTEGDCPELLACKPKGSPFGVRLEEREFLYILRNPSMTSVPATISRLTKIQKLHLRSNQLSSVPPEISQLTRLTELSVYNNRISDLPMEISSLRNLVRLDLCKNNFSQIPEAVYFIDSIEYMNISENEIQTFDW